MKSSDDHAAIDDIFDAFRGHSGEDVKKLLADNHILAVKVPSNCTDQL